MTKIGFYSKVNYGRFPKYILSQIKDSTPQNNCVAIVCTESDRILIAKYEYGIWKQAHFSSTEDGYEQEIYHSNIDESIKYWTDGKPEDRTRKQFEC